MRRVIQPQAHENYRVILKREDGEFEIGSIGIQHGAMWRWGIDTVKARSSFKIAAWLSPCPRTEVGRGFRVI
jgi:hypothetical protein